MQDNDNFKDSSSPGPNSESLPAFGSTIFSLHRTRDRPGINAHVSILFLEEKPEGSEADGDKGKQKADKSDSEEILASKEAEAAPGIPQMGEASTSKKEAPNWEELGELGWGAIIEEIPEEEIPEELRYRGPV